MKLSNTQRKKIHNRRFDEMRETKEHLKVEYEIFKSIIDKYRLFEDDKLKDYCLQLFERKMSIKMKNGKDTNVPIRAYFISKVMEYLCKYKKDVYWTNDKIEYLKRKLSFAAEAIIVIQYLDNQILDKKYISSDNELNQNLIASNILQSSLFEYLVQELTKDKKISLSKTFTIVSAIRKVFLYVDLGQRIDKEFNHFNSYKNTDWTKRPKFSPNSSTIEATNKISIIANIINYLQKETPQKANYIDLYFRRIFLTNVSLFTYFTELMADLLNSPPNIRESTSNFATCYGLALQVVNDNHDYVYIPSKNGNGGTVAKKSTDVFSDLRNKNITLPLIFHLDKNYKRLIEEYLKIGDINIIKDYSEQISKEVKNSGAIRASINAGRLIARTAISFLDEKNEASPYLADVCGIAEWNRFYHAFYPSK